MNKVILIGYLGQNPEVRGEGGSIRATVSIATNEVWYDNNGNRQEKTEWHNLVIWGSRANNFVKYLQKGDHVAIEGKITYYDTQKDGASVRYTNIVVHTWKRLNKRDNDDQQDQGQDQDQDQGEQQAA